MKSPGTGPRLLTSVTIVPRVGLYVPMVVVMLGAAGLNVTDVTPILGGKLIVQVVLLACGIAVELPLFMVTATVPAAPVAMDPGFT